MTPRGFLLPPYEDADRDQAQPAGGPSGSSAATAARGRTPADHRVRPAVERAAAAGHRPFGRNVACHPLIANHSVAVIAILDVHQHHAVSRENANAAATPCALDAGETRLARRSELGRDEAFDAVCAVSAVCAALPARRARRPGGPAVGLALDAVAATAAEIDGPDLAFARLELPACQLRQRLDRARSQPALLPPFEVDLR